MSSRYAALTLATGLRLTITDTRFNKTEELVFAQFPVRIGRNPLNDLRLQLPFVSQFHATLELQANALMLRDLGSRNGTLTPLRRAPAHEPIHLVDSEGVFSISALTFRARIENVSSVETVRAPRKGFLLGGLSEEQDAVNETQLEVPQMVAVLLQRMQQAPGAIPQAAPQPGPQKTLPKGALEVRPLQAQYKAARGMVAKVMQGLSTEMTALSPIEKEQLLNWAKENFPSLELDPEFRRLAEYHGIGMASGEPNSSGRRLEYLALQAVRELASAYVRGAAPISTEEDLVRFLTKVRDSLDMFFKCFIPLRDGYRQFKSDMDIRDISGNESVAQRGVARAQNPKALGELLLTWADDSTIAHKAVEGTFADLMIHQLALLSGIMRGVKSLVDELSPSEVDKALVDLRKKGKTGITWGPYRFRELWKVYSSRHADLADGDKPVHALLFGADFAMAYGQLTGNSAQVDK